jgi:uncharacterized membrane protein
MKLMCTIIGTLVVLIIIVFSPWPGFIQGVANELLAIPESSGDAVWEFVLKAFNIGVGYVLFPLVGGIIGLIVGYIIERRYD